MSKKILLDHSEFQKAMERAKAERVKTLRQYGVSLAAIASKVRAHRTFAVIAVLLFFSERKCFSSRLQQLPRIHRPFRVSVGRYRSAAGKRSNSRH